MDSDQIEMQNRQWPSLQMYTDSALVLLHATTTEIVEKYLRKLKPDKRQLSKVDSLRKLLSLEVIQQS